MSERPIDLLNTICEEIFQRWDKDQRSGKLLSALSGRFTGYRPDVTKVRRALESHDALVKALEEIASEATQWDWTDKDTADAALGKIATQMRALAREALAKVQPT